ncbi:MAG: hypothetical protein WCT11_00975 [Candidatus Magasanikbacteria bacterium]|jgi:hypothetical protein
MRKKLKIFLIIGIISLLLIIFYARIPTRCADLKCFITKADQCAPATYEEATTVGTMSYSIGEGTGNNCALTKQVVALNKNENDLIKKLLQDKQMNCNYLKNQFNGQWITSMIEGLDHCDGELKDAIGQLLLLVDVK